MDIEKFKNWLESYGCEILPPTNEFESIRWRGKEVGVLYSSGKSSNGYAKLAYLSFCRKEKWDGGPVKVGRQNTYVKKKKQLLERDGSKCFLCDKELGEDITVDHLIPLVAGGANELSNMVLMHEECNNLCGCMPLINKVRIAVNNRLK